MGYVITAIVVALFIGALIWRRRLSRPRQSDYEAIEAYARSNGFRVCEIGATGAHWRHWLRGNLLLSNISRTYLVSVEDSEGKRKDLHVAFDPLRGGELQVLR